MRFKYHDDLPEIDFERIGLIVAETADGSVLKCERDRDQEFQRSNEFISVEPGATPGAFGFVADGDAADRFLAQVPQPVLDVRGRDALHRGRLPKDIVIHTKVNADKEKFTSVSPPKSKAAKFR